MPREIIEKRFYFIKDDTLKKNISIAFEHIIFLIDIASKEHYGKLIRSSLYKDATVYTGTIVEACLYHILDKFLESGKIKKKKISAPQWKEISHGLIHEFSKKKRIRYVVENLSEQNFKINSNFVEVNRACLRGKILTGKEFKISEEIREARNRIHVSGLKEIDNTYSKEKLDEVFSKASVLIKKIERKLSTISS